MLDIFKFNFFKADLIFGGDMYLYFIISEDIYLVGPFSC